MLPGNHQIVFSRRLMGGGDTKAKLLAHHGANLIQPQGRECLPQPEFLAWHRAEALKEPAREQRGGGDVLSNAGLVSPVYATALE